MAGGPIRPTPDRPVTVSNAVRRSEIAWSGMSDPERNIDPGLFFFFPFFFFFFLFFFFPPREGVSDARLVEEVRQGDLRLSSTSVRRL